jgi:DNA-binding MarR family transcriptional regulator
VGGLSDRDGIVDALDLVAVLQTRYLTCGTSLTSRTLLAMLDARGPLRLCVLATALRVSPPSTTQLVARLERDGLVLRSMDPADARGTLVDITDAGRTLRAELRQS